MNGERHRSLVKGIRVRLNNRFATRFASMSRLCLAIEWPNISESKSLLWHQQWPLHTDTHTPLWSSSQYGVGLNGAFGEDAQADTTISLTDNKLQMEIGNTILIVKENTTRKRVGLSLNVYERFGPTQRQRTTIAEKISTYVGSPIEIRSRPPSSWVWFCCLLNSRSIASFSPVCSILQSSILTDTNVFFFWLLSIPLSSFFEKKGG